MHPPPDLATSCSSATTRTTGSFWAILFLAWLAAAGARWAAIGSLLPHDAELHERVFARQLELLEGAPPAQGIDPNAAYYPTLVPSLARLGARPWESPASAEEAEAERGRRVRRLRGWCALISSLVVPAVFWLGLRLGGPRTAVFGALFAATSLMAATLGWQARPHGVGTALFACALATIVEAARRRDLRWSLLAGASVGLALANLQSSILLVPALLTAHVGWWRTHHGRAVAGALVALVAAGVIALPFQPNASVADETIARGFANGSNYIEFAGHAIRLDAWHGVGFLRLGMSAWSFDPLLWLTAGAGLLLLASRAWAARASQPFDLGASVVIAFALPYASVVGLYDLSEPRFLSPLIPVAALIAGWTVAAWLESHPGANGAANRQRIALALLPIAMSAVIVTGHVRAQTRPDTERVTAAFLAHRAGSIALFPGAHFPQTAPAMERLDPERIVRTPLMDLDELHRARRDPETFVAAIDADWVVVPVWNPEQVMGRVWVLDQLREVLRRRARSVDRFVPWRDGATLVPYFYDDPHCNPAGPWWLCALRAERAGPAIEVYDLRARATPRR